MAGYHHFFCKNFLEIVLPLTNLLSQHVPFLWSDKYQQSFDAVTVLMASAPVLSAPDLSKPFKLEVDASSAGAVLIYTFSYNIWLPTL